MEIKKLLQKIDGVASIISILILPVSIAMLFNFNNIVAILLSILGVVLIIAVVALCATLREYHLSKPQRFSGQNSQIAENFYNVIRRMAKQAGDDKSRNDLVMLFGEAMMRPLYLGGCYEQVIKIGEIIIATARNMGRTDTLAKTSIELGWMSIVFGNNDLAKAYLNEGIEIAKNNGDIMTEAKGHRHLMALYGYSAERELLEYKKNYAYERKIIEGLIQKMPKGRDTDIFYGGVIYGDAEYMFCLRKYDEARTLSAQAETIRKDLGDNARKVRSYAQMGKIELFARNYEDAIEYFTKGYIEAVKEDRADEIVKNAYGKACYWLYQHNVKRAEEALDSIADYGSVKLPPNDQLIIDKYNSLKGEK